MLGAVVRRYGDFGAAEDAVQEALARRRDEVARRGSPGQPARLADSGGGAPHDRPLAFRELARRRRENESAEEALLEAPFAPAPGSGDHAAGRRHPARPLHVLSPGARSLLGDRAHPARGGRSHDR